MSIHNYDNQKAAFRTWGYKLTSNRLVQSIEDYDFEDEHDMTVSLEYKEDFERVTVLVNELDASSQQLVRLKLLGDYTFQEIASIETISLSTVKTKYYAALKRIRKGFEKKWRRFIMNKEKFHSPMPDERTI
ncbi:RNA polymerase sigma factor [Sporosarcina sp. BP05]|uniref:RNA polymerase sigma factor n=1 Tax=Sporosarcina sp. BP05 TaxID=2758726 RepID=UPI0021037603|nr:sigma factor-like helix-turn-helix DNA-binding protein [Sporosarcina sp. BP05]